MFRNAVGLCAIAMIVLSTAPSKASTPNPIALSAQTLCKAEANLQVAMKDGRKKVKPRGWSARIGKARGKMFRARATHIRVAKAVRKSGRPVPRLAQAKVQYCPKLTKQYLAASYQRVLRAIRSLCFEIRSQEEAQRDGRQLVDDLTSQLESEYRWQAKAFDEDVLRVPPVNRLPQSAPSLKQARSRC